MVTEAEKEVARDRSPCDELARLRDATARRLAEARARQLVAAVDYVASTLGCNAS
jgi:hypothetical protein